MKRKFSLLVLIAAFVFAAAVPSGAAPLAGPCAPGAAYNPACDVDQNGTINITDIQLTAGHWNQSGTFTSDNNHNHLGQTWTGGNNSLIVQGSFGAPFDAPLVLNNAAGHGMRVSGANKSGVYVDSAGSDGVFVCRTGSAGTCTPSSDNNGIEIGSAQHGGLSVGSAGTDGVSIGSAGLDGVYVGSVGDTGVYVLSAGNDGLYVEAASNNGVDVAGDTLAGYFFGAVQITGGCTGCLLTTFGVNAGGSPLAPGDVVALIDLRASGVDSVPVLMEVHAADGDGALVGVVQGRAEMVESRVTRPGEKGRRLVPREGVAEPGQYLTIAYSGLAQVRASGPIAQGSRLSAGANGAARAQGMVAVDGVMLAESAAVIGVALEAQDAGDGLIWALLNVR